MYRLFRQSKLWVLILVLFVAAPLASCCFTPPTDIPTFTAIPTAVPSATATPARPDVEDLVIPECVSTGEPQTPVDFAETIEAVWPALFEMDSYRYRAVYSYSVGDTYPDDELALEIIGAHSGLTDLSDPLSYYLVFTSQYYRHSHTVVTDLHTNSRTETIVTEDGVWFQTSDSSGWAALVPGTRAEFVNLSETFGPESATFMLVPGGTLRPGVRSNAPLMAQAETINDLEVMHRCWKEDSGYLVHYTDLYTFLEDVEVHLWTAENDTRLVRLALRGQHLGDRYFEEMVEHDPPHEFMLWVELFDVDERVDIEPPPAGQIVMSIPLAVDEPPEPIPAAYDEFPVPDDARTADSVLLQSLPLVPREYMVETYELMSALMGSHLGFDPCQTEPERCPTYQTEMGLFETTAFYLNEMTQRGWILEERFLQLGRPSRLFLFFARDEAILPVIIQPIEVGEIDLTLIWATLPPDAETLEAVLSGWTIHTEANSGLASDLVTAVAFDEEGRAWIGTNGEGVSVFDGDTWTTYNAQNSRLVSNEVRTIAFDEYGRAWIGTRDGMNVFDGETWTTHTVGGEWTVLADNSVRSVAVGPDGSLWFGTPGGVSRFDGESWITYTAADGLADDSVQSIVVAPDGTLWAGTYNAGVSRFDGQTWTTYTTADGLASNNIPSIAAGSGGTVWVGTRMEGVSHFDGESWTTYTTADGLADNRAYPVAVTSDGALWVGSWGNGVSHFDGETWTTQGKDELTYCDIQAMAVTCEDVLWVGTRSDGVSRFDGESWTTYTTDDGLANNEVRSIAVSPDGTLWCGTAEGGISRFDGETWTTYTTTDGLMHDYVDAIAIDLNGVVWAGTFLGASRFDGETWTSYTSEASHDMIRAIAFDDEGRVWAMWRSWERSGVGALNGETWTIYHEESIGTGHQCNTIAIDHQGRVWVGSEGGGVFVFDGQSWSTMIEDKATPGQTVIEYIIEDIVVDDLDRVWIASGEGLRVLDGETWTTYNAENSGLGDDWIEGLGIDQYNRVWAVTWGNGLFALGPDGEWTTYSPLSPEVSLYSPDVLTVDPQGRIWIGCDSGLAVFTPPAP